MSKLNILIVDDEPMICELLARNLEVLGEEIVTLESGLEALEFLRENDCALMLLDLHMSGLDGIGTAIQVRQMARFARMPIIFVTGDAVPGAMQECYALGAIDFLTKPFVAEVLLAKVRAVVDLAREARDARELRLRSAEVQESEQRYRVLVEHIPAVIYSISLQEKGGAAIYLSPQVKSLLGCSADSFKSAAEFWSKHIHPMDSLRVLKRKSDAVKARESTTLEYRMVTSTGRLVWVSDSGKVLCNTAGIPIFVQGVLTDITEQKRTRPAKVLEEVVPVS